MYLKKEKSRFKFTTCEIWDSFHDIAFWSGVNIPTGECLRGVWIVGVLYLTEIFGLGLCSSLHSRGSQASEASNCLEHLLKLSHQQVSFLANSEWGLRICFPNKFPGNVLIQSFGSWSWCTQNYQQSCATDNFNQTLRKWDQEESKKLLWWFYTLWGWELCCEGKPLSFSSRSEHVNLEKVLGVSLLWILVQTVLWIRTVT